MIIQYKCNSSVRNLAHSFRYICQEGIRFVYGTSVKFTVLSVLKVEIEIKMLLGVMMTAPQLVDFQQEHNVHITRSLIYCHCNAEKVHVHTILISVTLLQSQFCLYSLLSAAFLTNISGCLIVLCDSSVTLSFLPPHTLDMCLSDVQLLLNSSRSWNQKTKPQNLEPGFILRRAS